MNGMGGAAYVLPAKMYGQNSSFLPYIFTDDELVRLFSAIDAIQPAKHQPFADKILPVLFRLIYTCGLRPNEGRLLKTRNVFLDSGEILISETKGNKERIVVMSADMHTLCSDYHDSRPLFGTESEYFFSGSDGRPFSSTWLLKQLRCCWANANPGISPEELPSVRIYDLRHRFASAAIQRWLDAGADLNAKLPFLRAYMSHSTLSQTAYYIHLLPGNLMATSAVNWTAFEELIPEVEPCPGKRNKISCSQRSATTLPFTSPCSANAAHTR